MLVQHNSRTLTQIEGSSGHSWPWIEKLLRLFLFQGIRGVSLLPCFSPLSNRFYGYCFQILFSFYLSSSSYKWLQIGRPLLLYRGVILAGYVMCYWVEKTVFYDTRVLKMLKANLRAVCTVGILILFTIRQNMW